MLDSSLDHSHMEKLVELSSQEVQINFTLNSKCRATLGLRSLIATATVAFKVQTSSPNKFLVNPPSGTLEPLSSATLQLILKPQSHFPSHFPRSPSDRFLIKTAIIPEVTRPKFVNSWFGSYTGPTYDVKLGVAFVGPVLLRHAVGNGDVGVAKKIVKRKRGLVAELSTREAESMFQLATKLANSDEMVSFLIQAGLEVKSVDDEMSESKGWSDLHVAAVYDRMEEIVSLISGGECGPLDCRDKEGQTPLMLAAGKGHERCVRILEGAGADVDARSKDGRTSLYKAAANGDRRMVEVLMELGADPRIGAGDRGRSAFDVARDKGFKEIIDILEQSETVMTLARRGDSSHLKQLLTRGASPRWHDQYGLTPLHVAALKGHTDTIRILLDFKIEIDCRDNEGFTPLHLAVEGGCVETVEALVDRGSDLNAKSKRGATPIYIAKVMGYDDIYKFLYERGACNNSSMPPSYSYLM